LTPLGCDYGCCCDTDCNSNTVNAWKLQDFCIDEDPDLMSLHFEECIAKNSAPVIEDLQGGMTFYYKVYRRLLCVKEISQRGVAKTFVS
jgi:hypothetical protein